MLVINGLLNKLSKTTMLVWRVDAATVAFNYIFILFLFLILFAQILLLELRFLLLFCTPALLSNMSINLAAIS
ncbi:hypothetical protein BCR42DRAFT_427993 [Absidia repens]|uniref:Uncharacterized protein n=1 Tax=Absidia repens TaxID=90262 RepID=A0A1X2HYT7_9FUNG|nr:hypothetical protein BCR42DRAFT_427993 [Absidia repens]